MTHRRKELNTLPWGNGEYVLYWMQASVRVTDNLALAQALRWGAERSLPVAVVFCLEGTYPGAASRIQEFLLDGLADVASTLANSGLAFAVVEGRPADMVPVVARQSAAVVFDKGYLPHQRRTRAEVAALLKVPVCEVEDNLAVPVETVSDRDEWMAATLRPKLMRLASLEPVSSFHRGWLTDTLALPFDWDQRLASLGLSVVRLPRAPTGGRGGETAALAHWETFRDEKLDRYNEHRNDPNLDGQSGLSPFLRFGHLSPLTVMSDLKKEGRWVEAVTYRRAGEEPESKFLDELLVRRELSANFVWYNPAFASWSGLPAWARATLEAHRQDRREYTYSDADWEAARTHDEAWNAAQTQLLTTGTIHGYLRMYWGKKLLEWNADPAAAFDLAVRLNNTYALDGNDPNSWAGVAWCFGKHDRPWGERAVYGLVRCMTSGGLARKFDLDAYIKRFRPR